jgi:chitodextrinase
VPSGATAWTECVIGTQGWVNYMADPHFVTNPLMGGLPLPYTVFLDAGDTSNQCGDLDFTDARTVSVRSYYATDSTVPAENPWKYWWRRARFADDGTGDLDEVAKVIRSGHVFGWDTAAVALSDEYDAIGVIVVLNADSTLEIGDSVFIDPAVSSYYGGINVVVQHWAHREPPVFDSATVDGSSVSLHWTNVHVGRAVDSTNIYRNGAFTKTVGPAETSYEDRGLAPGSYAYSLKHVSMTAASTDPMGPAPYPNSSSSDTITVTVVTNHPPVAQFGVTCEQLPCTFADSSSDPDGTIASWAWTFGDGGSSDDQHPTHTYPAGGDYQVRLIVTDDLGARDTALGWAHPLQLGILGPTLVKPKVTCEWDAYPRGGSGGMTYAWWIGGQVVGTEEYLYWYTGRSGFVLTLIGTAGDGQVDTAAVTVTLDKTAPSCVLKRG